VRVDSFDFALPADLIAERPVEPRENARLLVVRPDGFEDRRIGDLTALLRRGDLLVFNDTRVIPARLFGDRTRNGQTARVELLLHLRTGPRQWHAFARPAKRLRAGDMVRVAGDLSVRVLERREEGEVAIELDCAGDPLSALEKHGTTPLPPYITAKRDADRRDRQDYQTSFAREPGAVAAPTAGLHFTRGLIRRLEAAGIGHCFVTLHVGAGTFLPVKAETTEEHRMHAEWGRVSAETAARVNDTRAAGGRIVAVGTTSTRLLESAAGPAGAVAAYEGETRLFISPGFRFRVVDLLVTNFHLPRSTLFMLVSAFAGLERAKAAYAHAIAQRYRFYSYGDATLFARAAP
jgi:S-adenosylmethionine:tRNA ribosyltransferase-isomerase